MWIRDRGINTYYDGYLSARMLGECFGTNEKAVKRWVEKFNLPAIKVKEPNRTRYQIDPEQFWKWADAHRNIINWSGYDLCSILPEPRWVEFEQARYKTKRHGQRFTQNEIVRIKHMQHRGLNTKEIAAEMGRTEISIRHVPVSYTHIEYKAYIFRYGSGYVPIGKSTLNKMLCEERLMKRLRELPEEKYDVTRYKILKRTVYTVCTKYEEVC